MRLPGSSEAIRRSAHARLAVGLMAGTSLDGVDAALVDLSGSLERPKVRLLAFMTTAYPAPLRNRLLQVAGGGAATLDALSALHYSVGECFARAAIGVCKRALVSPRDLTVVASH